MFHHEARDLSCVCHGDDFTLVAEEVHLMWIATEMKKWFELKVRAIFFPMRRTIRRWSSWAELLGGGSGGVEFEADPRHRKVLAEYFGFSGESAAAAFNGDQEKTDDLEDEAEMDRMEAKEFRGLVARMNYLSQDSPDLQYPSKESSREMTRPTRGAWRRLKKTVRYMLGVKAVVWQYGWQDEAEYMLTKSDSDWGGGREDRRSTSGGVIMLGGHCIKTWSKTQGAVALSSAEAEFYAMVDAVLKAKWLTVVSQEIGFATMGGKIILGTDSSAAKSFVCRRGLGKMRHIEIRDLWLQKEVMKGLVKIVKIPGDENPADLMTKFLKVEIIDQRLKEMNLKRVPGNDVKKKPDVQKKLQKIEIAKLVADRWADASDGDEEGDAVETLRWWKAHCELDE